MQLRNFIPFLLFITIISALYLSLNFPTNNANKLTNLKLQLNSGKTLDLDDFQGKPYIIHLFASWCSACKEDTSKLKELARHMNAPIIAIAISDNIEKVNKLDRNTLPYDYIAIDSNDQVKKLLKNKILPETILIDAEGAIILRHLGSL